LNAIINDPRVMGIIKECGGKMYMSEKKWDQALEELFDCFKEKIFTETDKDKFFKIMTEKVID